jgi:putative hydrolase of the HAD superfamily
VNSAAIKVVTFDLDDTLWDIWPVIAQAEARLHRWLEAQFPEITDRYGPQDLRALCEEVAACDPSISHDRTLLRKAALELAAERSGRQDFATDAAYEIFYAARNEVVFFEEVVPVLERLSDRYRIGALSNGNADLERIGLDHFFDFALNPGVVGSAKPEPDMFAEACRICSVDPWEIVHVGDDPELDVMAAASAGFRTVWVNRKAETWSADERAHAEVATLEELERVLEAWELAAATVSQEFEHG